LWCPVARPAGKGEGGEAAKSSMAEDVVTRTWGYCPIVSSADFAKGFAACARLSFNYSAGGPVAQSDSIAARVTNAAAAPGRRPATRATRSTGNG